MGGLYSAAQPQDLPEGASPRTWDTDYITGSVFTRPGLSSVYAYANTLAISQVVITSGNLGVFSYAGTSIPIENEGFVLEGFTGNATFLNDQTVFVISTNTVLKQFTAAVVGPSGTYSGLTGVAVSTVGQFVGPNAPTAAVNVDVTGNPWNNPTGILGNLTYASITTGTNESQVGIPTNFEQSVNGGATWSSPQNVVSSVLTATVGLGGGDGSTSRALEAVGEGFSIPSDATISGMQVNFRAGSTQGSTTLGVSLFNSLSILGTVVNSSIPVSSLSPYTAGSSSYLWGTTLTPSILNNASFGVSLTATYSGSLFNAINVNSLSITAYYSLPGSDELLAQTFNFTVQPTSGVTGIETTFQAYSSAATTVTLQLLKNGVAVGTPKTQTLTTIPTIYSLGGGTDLWGDTWLYSDINSVEYGVQITASGTGTTYINDVDQIVFITPGLSNFNYVKSYIQNTGQISTLALDANGNMWEEDVTDLPGILSLVLTGITPGSYAKSATEDDQEYILFSNLQIGTDRPRVFNGTQFLPLSQVGPGAPPLFQASVGSGTGQLTITAYSLTGNVVTFTYTGTEPTVGSLYLIEGVVGYLNGTTVTVLSTGLTPTQFEAGFTHANDPGGSVSGTATPTYSYSISSITQLPSVPFNGQELLWSAGPGQTAPGSTITFYYGTGGAAQDPNLVAALASGNAVYVYITGAPVGNGTWQVTGAGTGVPPTNHQTIPYFTIAYTSSAYQLYGGPSGSGPNGPGNDGSYEITLATVTVSTAIPDLTTGDGITISNVSPAGWDANWTIVDPLNSGVLNVTQTSMSTTGVASYSYNIQSGAGPVPGQIVTVTDATNSAIFNATGVISTVAGGVFTIAGFPGGSPIAAAFEASAVAVTFGTQFTFDPGILVQGTGGTSIFGNAGPGGTLTTVGGSIQPIGAGTRQGVVFFITESDYETTMSPPITFTVSSNANFITASNIPIGPPNVIGRGIAFTEAGQNGVPGANFYVIPNPVTITVGNTTTTYSSTIINDNITTSAKFTFTDAVLLNSTEVDIQGNDLFNLIELGSSAWDVPYAQRMFYGLQLNKVQNFNNLTFDGGYIPNPGGNIQPLGWQTANTADQTLLVSPITGQALYIKNVSGSVSAQVGLIYQSAYQDAYLVPIINPNTTYSVRVAADNPSGLSTGTLVIDLTDFNPGAGFGKTYGSFSVPLSSMTSNMQVFTGTLLTTPFTQGVSPSLQLRVSITGMGAGADCEIDRIEVFPTAEPYLKAQVYGSYIDDLEAIDASGSGGIIDTSTENSQPCFGGFVMHDELYLLKQNSWYATQDNPNSEPGGWSLREISNRVGTCGISAYDTGEEWCVTACRQGIYGFNGGQPVKISQELWNLWETINWNAGYSIWLRNDIVNKRILCAVPLPTGTSPTGVATATTQWLPNAPYVPAPTSPNVILMLNYQAFATFDELISGAPVHATMFGTLAAPDLRRKWSIWQIPSPYADFVTRQDGLDMPLFICNGIDSSKIYQLLNNQYSDDGAAINSLYTTYGHASATKASTIPIFGMHTKRYTVLQVNAEGAGNMAIRILPNTINPKYPYTVPMGINLVSPANDDWFRPINVKGQRAFLEFSTNAVGAYFQLNKTLITGKADPWSSLNPTGGGNNGIA
jgi:hypothetical protein